MRYKPFLFTLLLAANCVAMKAQVVYTKDPYVFLDMDLEAKENSAVLTIITRSESYRMKSFPKLTITMMNDSVLQATGKVRNSSPSMADYGGTVDKTHYESNALFHITPQQAELFQAGIKRIEIQMEPYWFSHDWEEDELGAKLYERYAESKTHRLIKK